MEYLIKHLPSSLLTLTDMIKSVLKNDFNGVAKVVIENEKKLEKREKY